MVRQRQRVLKGAVTSEHIVQLFDAPESLGDGVAAFLEEGSVDGARLVVAAKASHLPVIAEGMSRRGMSMRDLVASGVLTTIDARTTLNAILRRGMPDARLFDVHLGDLVARLTGESGAPLRIYGELVEILAEEGSFSAAEALEDLWNDLGTMVPFTLMCGYSSAHFAAPDAGSALQHICARHTRVHQSQADILGGWLLDRRGAAAGIA